MHQGGQRAASKLQKQSHPSFTPFLNHKLSSRRQLTVVAGEARSANRTKWTRQDAEQQLAVQTDVTDIQKSNGAIQQLADIDPHELVSVVPLQQQRQQHMLLQSDETPWRAYTSSLLNRRYSGYLESSWQCCTAILQGFMCLCQMCSCSTGSLAVFCVVLKATAVPASMFAASYTLICWEHGCTASNQQPCHLLVLLMSFECCQDLWSGHNVVCPTALAALKAFDFDQEQLLGRLTKGVAL
jgi:hypothetical protein